MIYLLACSSAKDKPTVVADHTDVFQLIPPLTLLNYIIYMGTSRQIISITTLKNNLDHSLVRSLLFMHAISGCDTTSRPYGIGKVTVLSMYAALSRAADMFLSAKSDIVKLGEKALLVIRGCTSSLTLNDSCVARLLQRVATSTQCVYRKSYILQVIQLLYTVTELSIKFRRGMVETYLQENRVGNNLLLAQSPS